MGRPKTAIAPYEQIIFEIVAWEPSYSFSVAQPKGWRPSIDDHFGIEADGRCLLPARLTTMTHALDFWGDRTLPPEPSELVSNRVADFKIWRNRGHLLLALPHDAIWHLAAALAAGWIRYVLLWGPQMKRGKTMVQSVEFKRTVDLADY